MLQVIPKWEVTVHLGANKAVLQFWIFDHALGNVLRQVASMQFTKSGLEQPSAISIGLVRQQNIQDGVTIATNVAQGGLRVDPILKA